MKQKSKPKKPKLRIPVAPPTKIHKSDKDYNRQKSKKEVRESWEAGIFKRLMDIICNDK